MTKTSYFDLDAGERESALRVAAEAAGRDAHLLEKDVWVVWTLDVLFRSRFGPHLVFKGGTSLSKVHRAIDRFSEDVDVTYDIRELVPPAREAEGALPQSGSQARRWSEAVAEELPKWVRDEIAPLIETALVEQDLSATVEVQGSDLKIRYEPSIVEGYGYIKPRVLLEFGGRSTGEPCDEHDVTCDAAVHLPDVVFPTARPRTMRAERTFWEKATAIHGYATGGRLPGLAIARHWLDVYNMAEAGIAERATGDRDLASQVADHKKLFFRVTTPTGPVDYHRAVTGELRLVPEDDTKLANLADDYVKMLDARLPHGETAPSFDDLMRGCAQIAERINAATRSA